MATTRTFILGRTALWWVLLALTAGALVAVNVFHFPPAGRHLLALTGGERILDMQATGYGTSEVRRLLVNLGPEGRRLYLELLWTLDLILPALFSWFLWMSMSFGELRRWRWAALLGGMADYLENATITLLLVSFPAQPWGLVQLASALTSSKFALYLAGLVLAVAGFVGRQVIR